MRLQEEENEDLVDYWIGGKSNFSPDKKKLGKDGVVNFDNLFFSI